MMALLYENGPFYIDENLQPQENNFSWTKKYHMLYIDSPVGTG
jgi:carboxypeptidase C (cathepsin A)